LLPAETEDVLEADEMWSFVSQRANKRWIWTVLCRRTRQIVAKCLSENYIEQDLSASHVNKCQPVLRFFAPAHGNAAAFG
jgi:hypothetical protein